MKFEASRFPTSAAAEPLGSVTLPRRSLAQGTMIDAEIEAHLLGLRLLRLKARITALPATKADVRPRPLTHSPLAGEHTPSPAGAGTLAGKPAEVSNGALNGEVSGGLAEAAKSLAAGAADLRLAREQWPARRFTGS